MIPLLLATARTGSSIISNLMYQLGKNQVGYKNYLNEFFTVNELFKPTYEIINNVITQTSCTRLNSKWFVSAREERLSRLMMIADDPKYALKVFPEDLEPEILDFIKKHYKIIGLERLDKEDQFISFSHMLSTNIAAYSRNDSTVVDSIKIDKKHISSFVSHIKKFQDLQYKLDFPVIYYEDFINETDKIKFIADNFGLDYKILSVDIDSKETPYTADKKEIIENVDDWKLIRCALEVIL